VKLAVSPLNRTAVVPVKFVPAIVTLAPTAPLAGVKLVSVGGRMTVKPVLAVPPDVVVVSNPVVAPAGTVVRISPSQVTVNGALTPLKATSVAPVKFEPPIRTSVPTVAVVGVTFSIAGGRTTVKLVALVAVPPGVVTLNGPDHAPAGTVV
jgi:hypothetical protein